MIRFEDIDTEEEFECALSDEWNKGALAGAILTAFLFTILWVLFTIPTFLRWIAR